MTRTRRLTFPLGTALSRPAHGNERAISPPRPTWLQDRSQGSAISSVRPPTYRLPPGVKYTRHVRLDRGLVQLFRQMRDNRGKYPEQYVQDLTLSTIVLDSYLGEGRDDCHSSRALHAIAVQYILDRVIVHRRQHASIRIDRRQDPAKGKLIIRILHFDYKLGQLMQYVSVNLTSIKSHLDLTKERSAAAISVGSPVFARAKRKTLRNLRSISDAWDIDCGPIDTSLV